MVWTHTAGWLNICMLCRFNRLPAMSFLPYNYFTTIKNYHSQRDCVWCENSKVRILQHKSTDIHKVN